MIHLVDARLARPPDAAGFPFDVPVVGEGLDAQSHGECFLRFFEARLVPGGTYFLADPVAFLRRL